MGKTPRRSRLRYSLKSNPIADNDFAFEEELPINNIGPIDAIKEQLQNANIEEKINGLQSLAVLAANKGRVTALLSSADDELLRIAAPLLCDKDFSVRNAAAGAIRNLSVCGPDVCEYLVDKDVSTPLIALLHEYAADTAWIPSFDSSIEGQIDIRSDVFLQAINLLWNLCESSSIALDIFNQSQLLDGIIRCLDFKMFGLDIAISVAQCLLVVSESNPKIWNAISKHVTTFLYLLDITEEYGQVYLRTLSAGILSNVPALGSAYTIQILNSLSQTLDTDHISLLNALDKSTPNQENNCPTDLEVNMELTEDESYEEGVRRRRRQELPTEVDILKRNAGYLLDALRVSMEIITNLCESEEEEEYIDSEEDMSDCESIVDGMGVDENNSNICEGEKLPLEIMEAFKSLGLIDKIWQKAQPIQDSLAELLRETSMFLYMKTKSLRISSLICLQNFCNSLRSEDLGGSTAIYNVWVELGKQVFKETQDPTLLEPATSLMRSALAHLKISKELFNNMTKSDLELILDGVRKCAVTETRANWLRMLGTLGCLLPEHLVKMIISFIVETCSKEDDVWTMSEALDSLMDIFSDNDWHELVIDLGLCKLTKGLDNIFKAKIREQRRELNERYAAVKTVRVNFTRFVLYLEDESMKYKSSK